MENVNFDIAKDFFKGKLGKVLVLHMSESYNRDKTFQITSGIINNYVFYDGTEKLKEGFSIQLEDKNGRLYGNTENFFGNFESFQVEEKAFSDTLKIVYKDGSYFIIEIRI